MIWTKNRASRAGSDTSRHSLDTGPALLLRTAHAFKEAVEDRFAQAWSHQARGAKKRAGARVANGLAKRAAKALGKRAGKKAAKGVGKKVAKRVAKKALTKRFPRLASVPAIRERFGEETGAPKSPAQLDREIAEAMARP